MTNLVWGLAAPIAGFYVVRALGIDPLVALLAGAAATQLGLLVRLVRNRRLDGLSSMFACLTLLSLGVTLLDGSPRFLLAKDGLITAASGLRFVAGLWHGARPAGLLFGRPLMEPIMPTRRDWDEMWDNEPVFRRCWRVVTAIWSRCCSTPWCGSSRRTRCHRRRPRPERRAVDRARARPPDRHQRLLPPCRSLPDAVRPFTSEEPLSITTTTTAPAVRASPYCSPCSAGEGNSGYRGATLTA
jgi:hypothetical protein